MNVRKCRAGIDRCVHVVDDVTKCESATGKVNELLTNVKNTLTEVERERQSLYTSEHSLKKYASNKLEFVSTVKEQLNKLRKEFQKASVDLSGTLIALQRKFPHRPKNS